MGLSMQNQALASKGKLMCTKLGAHKDGARLCVVRDSTLA